MVVNLEELRLITEKLFDHLKDNNIKEVTLDVDYYWYIHKEFLYDPYKQPADFSIGQLSDDLNELLKILKDEPALNSYHFVWLSTILRTIGEFTS